MSACLSGRKAVANGSSVEILAGVLSLDGEGARNSSADTQTINKLHFPKVVSLVNFRCFH